MQNLMAGGVRRLAGSTESRPTKFGGTQAFLPVRPAGF